MSNHVTSLLRKRMLGLGSTAKSVAKYLGDLASDDGSGIWASKQTIANEMEMSKRTIHAAISALIEAGFLSEVGRRKHQNGFTFEYALNVSAIENCPESNPKTCRRCTRAGDAPVQEMHPTRAGDAPQDVQEMHPNHPRTTLEPEETPVGPPSNKPKRAISLPEGWVPNDANLAYARSKQFSEEEISDEADQFRDHHLARGSAFKDWDAAWRTWVRNALKFRGRGMARQSHSSRYGQGGTIASIAARRALGG